MKTFLREWYSDIVAKPLFVAVLVIWLLFIFLMLFVAKP